MLLSTLSAMDPLSITASVIAVAGAAYDSSTTLYNLIQTYRHASKIFEELSTDISGLQVVLSSLQGIGGEDKGERFSQAQCHLLKELEPAILNCSYALRTFNVKVGKLFSNSNPEHVSKRDKVMLHFQSNNIAAVRVQLENYKSTLTIALLVTSMSVSFQIIKRLT
ncbi:hypothetical protein N0V92_009661 [Colletotrichum tropicale]|nr:hypothetical protein N0V92_009661 [Colletotrichum tropicale]